MSDPAAQTPSRADPPRTRGWVKVVLAISLALNLAIVGLAAGAMLRNGGPPGRDDDRDFGLGPLADALSREDRRALRSAFLDRYADGLGGRAALRADFDALLAALRAEPFDPAALDAAFASIAARNADLLDRGRAVVADYLKGMDAATRADFADRLETALLQGDRRDKWRGDGHDAHND